MVEEDPSNFWRFLKFSVGSYRIWTYLKYISEI